MMMMLNSMLFATIIIVCAGGTAVVLSMTPMQQQQQQNANATTTTTTTTNAGDIGNGGGIGISAHQGLTGNNNSAPAAAPRAPPRVRVNKCCHFDEYLTVQRQCVAGYSEHWVPLIYLINRKNYYQPKGGYPKFITFEENVKPVREQQQQQQQQDGGGVIDGCTSVDELEYFSDSSNVLFSNGSLFLADHGKLIEPRNYCVDRESALVCLPQQRGDVPQPRFKLRKCCGMKSHYDTTAKACAPHTSTSNANEVEKQQQLKLPGIDDGIYQTIYGFPKCQESATTSYAIAGEWQAAKFSTESGQLQLHRKNFTTADYCLEYIKTTAAATTVQRNGDGVAVVKVFTCLHHFTPNAANGDGSGGADGVLSSNGIASSDDDATTTAKLQIAVLNFSIVISVVFLAATLVAGYMMPSVHHVLHWHCQIYYVLFLLIGDFLLAFTQISRSVEINSTACLLLASSMHFAFLSAFFWLNTMCFNIWWTFRDFRPSSLERNQEVLRLRLYSAYALGIPLLITVTAACVNNLPNSTLLNPGFGVRGCWFSGEQLSIFAYFFGPIGLLLCANIVLFISTTHQLTCGLWKRDDVKSTTEKTALVQVCLKLVIVMGVTWIADVASWLIGGSDSLWFFTDIINALQGVFIFIVVGCQPQVWSACKRICCPRSRQEITNTTNGVQHSSSSQGPSVVGGGGGGCGGIGGGENTQNTSINTTMGESMVTVAATANSSAALREQSKIPMETVC